LSTTTRRGGLPTDAPVGPPTAGRISRWIAAFGIAWLVPVGTHLLGVDWLLPPVLLVGLMSLQGAGRSLLDRLVLAVAQLFATLCAAGLVLSVWPWHLHPVPIAGCAFTALVLLALVTGRVPRLPTRVPARDAVTWLAVLAVAVLAVGPFAVRDLGGRIGLVAPGEDMARHFLLFDMIGKLGGYAFLHRSDAAAFAPSDYGFGYPQGTHLLYAVLDRFARSSAVNADPVTGMNVLLWCHVGTYVFLAMALLWAVRRVAGPGPDIASVLAVSGAVGSVLYFGDLFTAFLRGYPNELLGLALVAMLTAVLARPLAHGGEQIVAIAALVLGISFAYHLYLPFALCVTAVWAWCHRRTLRRRLAISAAVLVLPLAMITPLLNRPSGAGTLLLTPGTAIPVDRPVLWLAVLTAVAGLLARGGLRAPARRMMTVSLVVAVGMVAGLFAYQDAMVGHSVYYFEKLLHMLLVVSLVGLGAAARLLPSIPGPARLGRSARYVPVLAGIVMVALLLGVFGGQWHSGPPRSAGLRYALGLEKGLPVGGRLAVQLAQRPPRSADRTVDVVLADTPYTNFSATLFASVLRENYRYGESWYVFLSPSGAPRTLADLEAKVRASPVPVRFFVRNPHASFLVVDPERPSRPPAGSGVDPAAFGDPAAPTDVEAARYLAERYPDRVEVVELAR
jgi:hypothetical protein